MDKLNIRIEAARLAVESGADKETFDEMAKVIGNISLEHWIYRNMTIRMRQWRRLWIFLK